MFTWNVYRLFVRLVACVVVGCGMRACWKVLHHVTKYNSMLSSRHVYENEQSSYNSGATVSEYQLPARLKTGSDATENTRTMYGKLLY